VGVDLYVPGVKKKGKTKNRDHFRRLKEGLITPESAFGNTPRLGTGETVGAAKETDKSMKNRSLLNHLRKRMWQVPQAKKKKETFWWHSF